MTVIDIFSGFLGAGKTTLIKKLIAEAFRGQKLVLIENEFGEIGIDGAFLREAGGQAADLEITEMPPQRSKSSGRRLPESQRISRSRQSRLSAATFTRS